jgi:hypothetical protein
MEKQAYALVKSLKHFRPYVGYSRIIAYVHTQSCERYFSQQDCLGTRGKWVSRIQEYDMDIRPTKLVKGQGLAKMLVEGNERALDMSDEPNPEMIVAVTNELEKHEWYLDIVYYLKNLSCPNHLVDYK